MNTQHSHTTVSPNAPGYTQGIIGLLLFLVGLWGMVTCLQFAVETFYFERDETPAYAKVTERIEEKDAEGSRFYMSYQFEAFLPDETWRTVTKKREAVLSYALYTRTQVGDDIPIVYARDAPGISCIKGNYEVGVFGIPLPPLSFFIPLCMLFFIGGFLVVELFQYKFIQYKFMRYGILRTLKSTSGQFIHLLITMITTMLSYTIIPLLNLMRFKRIICNHCLRYSHPLRTKYVKGKRYCEHCQHIVEQTEEPGQVIVTFGTFSQSQIERLTSDRRVFFLDNPDFEKKTHAIEISKVWIDPATCDHRLLERFMTYILSHPPEGGVHSVHIFFQGTLEGLGEHLKNAVQNTFKWREQI